MKLFKNNNSVKVPLIMQLESLECGAACLSMILAYYGKWVPIEQVRDDCGVSRDGVNAKRILLAAKNYGMKVSAFRYEPEDLRSNGSFPCIIHWNFNHFVVLDGFKGERAVINDPANGVLQISMEEFGRSFTGVCLFMEPAEGFESGGNRRKYYSNIFKRLRSSRGLVGYAVTLSLLTSFFAMINPVFSKIFIDRLLTGQSSHWLYSFIMFMLISAFLQISVGLIEAVFYLKAEGKLAVEANAKYVWHILRLPISFFSQRSVGDIANRKDYNEKIVFTLINTVAPMIISFLLMIIYIIVMIRSNPVLALIGISGLSIDIFLTHHISAKKANIEKVKLRDTAKLISTTVSGIEMIEAIKAGGAENGFFEKWSGCQASINTQNVKSLKIQKYLIFIPELIKALTDLGILAYGLNLVIEGRFTVGILFAFQGLFAGFSKPISDIIKSGDSLREMQVKMERVDDVMAYSVDVSSYSRKKADDDYSKLNGKIELKNVTFGYSKYTAPLLRDFSLTIEPGKRIALIGASGCGKSTVANLMLGLYRPWSGEILYDDKPIEQIDRSVFTGSITSVDQEIILFEDTIANNIKMWDSTIEDFEMILAARDACIHEDILQRQGGYHYVIAENGKDFSGGQRQRLEIARALAQDPTIIILDEATSALDAKTESDVIKAVCDRGVTMVIIAHRLSTVRDCDEIIVLDDGRIVERGTHEELIKKQGNYVKLITAE